MHYNHMTLKPKLDQFTQDNFDVLQELAADMAEDLAPQGRAYIRDLGKGAQSIGYPNELLLLIKREANRYPDLWRETGLSEELLEFFEGPISQLSTEIASSLAAVDSDSRRIRKEVFGSIFSHIIVLAEGAMLLQ